MAAQTSDHSQDCIGGHCANDTVSLANDSEEKQDAEHELQPSPEWSIDPKNPVNWSSTRKWSIMTLLWATVTVTAICSTAFEPALSYIMADFGTSNESVASFTISVYVIGYCFGPLLTAPASELYGRVPVLYLTFIVYLVALAVCGSSTNIVVFILFRALMGFAGITFMVCGAAVIADVIPPQRRGLAMSLMTSGPTLGPTLGPIFGGYIAENIGWRWIFWISIACLGALMIGFMPIMKETFPPVLLAHQQSRHQSHLSGAFASSSQEKGVASQVFLTTCTRPLRFMFRTRLIPLLTLSNSIINSYVLILLSTLGTTFETVYHFSPGISGLAYLGMMVGFLVSEVTLGLFSDNYATRKARRRPEGIAKPEDCLSPLILGTLLLPACLLLYGWTLEQQTMWLAPVVGSGLVAFAAMYSYIPVQIYVVDVYTLHAASATGAMSIVRSAIAAIVPLGADPLYKRLGYGWAYTLLAGLAVPFIGVGLVLVRKGERIRRLDSPVA